jgi:hypothetical protein
MSCKSCSEYRKLVPGGAIVVADVTAVVVVVVVVVAAPVGLTMTSVCVCGTEVTVYGWSAVVVPRSPLYLPADGEVSSRRPVVLPAERRAVAIFLIEGGVKVT